MYYNQSSYTARLEWGMSGLQHVADSDVLIVVDVLSFSTCVDIAVENNAIVYPYSYRDASAHSYATARGALLAAPQRTTQHYSLSPTSLQHIPPTTKLVLPSPNGSALSFTAQAPVVMAGCLRNAAAVARAARVLGSSVTVLAAGEHWPDGNLRFAVEDLLGAGAILAELRLPCSPEAHIALNAFTASSECLHSTLAACSSGRELIERGFADDVALAAQHNCSTAVPLFNNGAFCNQQAS